MIFPIVSYGSESWTIKKKDRKSIDSFELWCWRRLLNIPWTAKRTNQSVIDEIRPHMSFEAQTTKFRLSYFGHIMRREESLEKDIMLGKVEGKRARGRPPVRWLGMVKEDLGVTLNLSKVIAQDRANFRRTIHDVAINRLRLDGT